MKCIFPPSHDHCKHNERRRLLLPSITVSSSEATDSHRREKTASGEISLVYPGEKFSIELLVVGWMREFGGKIFKQGSTYTTSYHDDGKRWRKSEWRATSTYSLDCHFTDRREREDRKAHKWM